MTTLQLDQQDGQTKQTPPAEAREITCIYCCDLLSLAMAQAPANSAWVTVMGNRNTIAVASLADVACVILAADTAFSDDCIAKAEDEGVTVYRTAAPIFETAKRIDLLL